MLDSAPIPLQVQQTVTIHLQKIPLLAGVDQQTLERVGSSMQVIQLERGKFAVLKGDPGEHLMFLLTGRLQVVDLTKDGKEIGLDFFSPGDYFGELSIIDGLPRSASVVACENSLIALLPRKHAVALITQNPLIAERLLVRLSATIRTASSYREILAIPNAFQRVFALLIQFSKTAPGGLVVIEKMPTQQEISIMVNTSRETVSRAIHILIKQGVVEKDMRRLIVRLPNALLKAVSHGDENMHRDETLDT